MKHASWIRFTNELEKLIGALNQAAKKSILETKPQIKQICVPWWNNECEDAIKKTSRVLNEYKKKIVRVIKTPKAQININRNCE